MEVAKTYQNKLDRAQGQLERIKENVKNSHEGFRHNYERFQEFRKFIFETSLSSDDITLLNQISKPQIEFNITESYISRLMGEFSKQEPSIRVGAEEEDQADPQTIHVVEQHMRHLLRDTSNNHVRWELMKDLYSGGFSVAKVWTDYAHAKSFKQVLKWDRAFDPTLCGFDLLARQSHKGDGEFCYEIYPYTENDFKRLFPDIKIDKMSFNRSFAGFNWSYTDGKQNIVLVCDYYEKKKRKVKIVELSDNRVVTMKEYESMIASWSYFEQPPAIRGKPRWTELETICRYRVIDTQVIEYVETDFTFFPLVFFDGNSITIKNPKTSNSVQQYTRPYVYHTKGAQRLKNFAGISLANEIENSVQHKFLVAKEALPKEEDWLQAYKDWQKPSTLVYNAFFEQDPDKPIPVPIREIQRTPCPPEITQTFMATDSLIQNILGSYDASLGINDNQLSGVAVVEAATQSNAAAMPYVVGFLHGLQRVGQIFLDLIPKYYTTPRTIPVLGLDGKADYIKVNQDGAPNMFYDTNALNISVEAGVSYQIEKSRALNQLLGLMKSSELFNRFMNEKGLSVLLDNIEIRGIDQLKLMVKDWEQELQQQKQMAMEAQQQQMQNNPLVMRNNLEMAKLQSKAQSDQSKLMLDFEKLKQGQLKIMADLKNTHSNNVTQLIKAETERFAKQVDLAIKNKDMQHRHHKDHAEFYHKVNQPHKEARIH